jgi:hypothetical protein
MVNSAVNDVRVPLPAGTSGDGVCGPTVAVPVSVKVPVMGPVANPEASNVIVEVPSGLQLALTVGVSSSKV